MRVPPDMSLRRTSSRRRPVAERGSCGRRIVLVVAVLVAAVAFASEHLDLSIYGVTLGTLKPEVQTFLGKAVRSETGHDDEMGMGDLIDLTYPGLLVQLCKPDGLLLVPRVPEFHVWRIQVTDARWEISPGLRVGMSRAALERVLGKPQSSRTNDGITALTFSPFTFDALMWAKVRNGVVIEIGMVEDWV
jgi:hypothetical protein